MKNKINNIMKKPFIQNVFILASGTAAAQALNMIFSPLITRFYGPEAYGLMGTFTAIAQVVGPIAAFSYPIAIVLPKSDDEANILVRLSIITTIVNTSILFLTITLFSDFLQNLFKIEISWGYLYLLPVVILTTGLAQIIQQILIRENLFKVSAISGLIETFLINGGKLAVGFIYPKGIVLVLFTAFRQGMRALLMFSLSKKYDVKKYFKPVKYNKEMIVSYAKKYKDFPIFRTSEITLSALTNSIPVILLTSLFGPASAGFYSLSRTVLAVPSTLIAQSVGDVFYPRVAKSAQNNEKIVPLIIQSTFYLAMVGIIPYGLIMLFGPQLFSFVFGQEWFVAGEYARWVSLWSYFNFINRPSVQTLPVISAQKFQLIFSIIKFIVTTLGLVVGFTVFHSDTAAIFLFSIIGAFSYIFLIFITISKSKQFDKDNLRKLKDSLGV